MPKAKYILGLILTFSLVTRVYRLEEPLKYYFDEVYHAFTAEAYSRNDPKGYEWWHSSDVPGTAYEWLHPPVAKLVQGLSIFVLGNDSFAWRLPSALFGVMVVGGVYFLAKNLFESEEVALVSAGVASLDGLLLAQSRITMNDIFVAFFMVMALSFYWRWNKLSTPGLKLKKSRGLIWEKDRELVLAGVFTGLAVATKWSGVFVLGVVGVWEVVAIIKSSKLSLVKFVNRVWKFILKRSWKLALAFLVLPISIYVLSFGQFWLQGHTLDQFRELHNQIWWYQNNLETTHPYQSKPWEWVLNLKPVWYHVSYQNGKVGNIYALANPVVAWGGLVAMMGMVYWGWKKKKESYWFLVLAYLMMWLPWVLSPRIMFFYHYILAMPFLAIALGAGLVSMWRVSKYGKWFGVGVIGLMALAFVYFYPHWTGMVVSKEWSEQYIWFESWR